MVNIAKVGIALGVSVMLIALGVVTGFKSEIKNKITGFNAHIFISEYTTGQGSIGAPMPIELPFYSFLPTLNGIKAIEPVSLNPVILEHKTGIQGIMLKGIGSNYDTNFFQDKIIEGSFVPDSLKNGIIIGSGLAKKMEVSLGDRILVNYLQTKGDLKTRRYPILGIFKTGLEEFDQKVGITHLENVQQVNKWGLDAILNFTTEGETTYLEAKAFGGSGVYHYEWLNPPLGETSLDRFEVCITDTITFSVVALDNLNTIADTAWLKIFPKTPSLSCTTPEDTEFILYNTGGSHQHYTNGFEVFLDHIDLVDELDFVIYNNLPPNLKSTTIFEQFPEIFNWLEMLDINVIIIIVLMIIVAVINMTSALLVIILEKVKTIGILKTVGASNGFIRRIFVYQGALIVFAGMLYGNGIALLCLLIQNNFSIITLDPETYYIDKIPLLISGQHFLFVNLFTFLVCFTALILPSWLVSNLKPAKSIRFA
ncbi:MAG: FtsX-like permease family protein [Luteibaculaceae bacterium]